ncbi:MAG: hypothetical protein IPL27_27110 [Lewinellaceae bacterium]|nr:hypothetical protein [Lewinellaceae bacterium]
MKTWYSVFLPALLLGKRLSMQLDGGASLYTQDIRTKLWDESEDGDLAVCAALSILF